jgi:hypothetical protein
VRALLAGALLVVLPAAGAGCGGDDGCPTTHYDYGEEEAGLDTPQGVLSAEAIASLRLPDDVAAWDADTEGDGDAEGDTVTFTFADDTVEATLVVRRGRSAWVLDSSRICDPEP